MNLTCETILDFYEHKNKKILCQIKSLKPKTTCRSLTPELWSVFDKKLEKLISTTDDWNNGKCLKFNITPDIVVEVQKSKLSAKNFHICLDSTNARGEHSNGILETDFVLECVFDFQEPKTIRSSTDNQEYVPQIETTPEGKPSSPAAYEPYTPSKRLSRACSFNGIKSSSLDTVECNEDTYSPKPLYEDAEIDPQITEDIPKYTPAPIKTISSSLSDKSRNEANPSGSNKSLKSNLNDKLESEYVPTSQEIALNNVPVYIPTPIDNNQPKVFKANIRKHKRRSKTIDEYPLEFLEYSTDKYRIIEEELEKEKKEIKTYEKRFSIQRSKTIDEMPAVLKHNIKHYFRESRSNLDKEFKSFNENLSSVDKVLSAENKLTTSSSKDAINSVFLIEKELQKYPNQKEIVERSRRNKEIPRGKVVGENNACLRRSDRSLSKPKRFIEEQPNLLKKPKGKTKTSHKTRELFGTDDEDDDETPTVTTVGEYNAELDSTDISLSYEPYTPTKKKYRVDNIDTVKTPGIDILKAQQKDTICTEILSEGAKDDSTASEEIPNTPVSIKAKTRRGSRGSNKSSRSDLLGEVIVETCDELESPKKVEKSKIKSKENKSIEEISRRKQRKRSKTLDEMPILGKEDIPIDKVLEDNRSSFKHCHYEHKKLKKRSQSTEELAKFKKIITEENRSKTLESISESSTNLFKKKKNASNENISNSKSKANAEKHDEYFSSTSCDDDLNIPDIKLKNSNSSKKTSDDEFEDTSTLNKNIKLKETDDNCSNLNISISSATAESATDTSPTKVKRGRKQKVNISSSGTITSLRRSERSPNKPLRYTVDISEINKKPKSKKQKSSPTNKDLFGTDYDEDDDDFENNNDTKIGKNKNKTKSSPSIFETPVTQKMNKSASSSSSSSAKKKRKRDKSSDCEQEKRDISKWLSKKKSTPTEKEGTKITSKEHKSKSSSKKDKKQKSNANAADSRSNSPSPVFEMPSKEELELIRKKTELTQKENAKLKAELEKFSTGPPKEVEFLSLQKLTVEEILNTFSTYKSDLDEIYESNCKRDYIKSHDGINHCFIIRLLQQNVQMKMLEKLTNVYSNTKSSTQATLFANALLPEWVIRVYMKQFKFTRQEAIDQIKAQEEFQLHKEEQSDNSFMFD